MTQEMVRVLADELEGDGAGRSPGRVGEGETAAADVAIDRGDRATNTREDEIGQDVGRARRRLDSDRDPGPLGRLVVRLWRRLPLSHRGPHLVGHLLVGCCRP